jgi:dihydroorotase
MAETFDLLLSGGTVLNPATNVNGKLDVAVTGGRIAAIQTSIPRASAKRVIDVAGCYVTPGLIDFHVHSYWGVNPYGCDLDALCLATGVTTTMDAGSAGPVNLLGFRKLVHNPAKTRMLGFVALAQHGVLNEPGELLDLDFADSDGAAQAITDNRDISIGVKVRLHKKSIGENSRPALRLVRAAKERGVIFDVGHAGGHFDFNLVERAMGDGLLPDIISSDLHSRLAQPGFGVVGDLLTTLTKFLPLGLSLEQIIAGCTVNAARAIGWQERIGSLEAGRDADITVLQIVDEPTRLRDSVGGEITYKQRIAARWTVRAGEVFQGKG